MLSVSQYLKHFDPTSAQIEGAPMIERHLSQLEGCFADASAYTAALKHKDALVYSVSSFEPASNPGDLHIGLGQLMPGRVGSEFFLTRGHLHTWREASEIYIGLSGDGLMLLELEGGEATAVPLRANSIVYVPGHTAHRTVNVGSSPLTYLGIYPAQAGHDYAAIAANNFRQVVIERGGQAMVMKRSDWLEAQRLQTES
jgi:glucose-6-phosphate isomerase, archaeal